MIIPKGDQERRDALSRRRLRLVLILLLIVASPHAALEIYRNYLRLDPDWRYIEDVILATGEPPRVTRWSAPLKVAVFSATEADERFVHDRIAAFDGAFGGGAVGMTSSPAADSNVTVYFVPRKAFGGMVDRVRAVSPDVATGYYIAQAGDDGTTRSAIVMVGSDVADAERRAAIVHQIAHVVGLRGHSKSYPESVVVQSSLAAELAPIDRKALGFLYRHLKPGATWFETAIAYHRYW